MAEANISVSQDQFNCPVCLDLLKDPVTVPCGHSYCMSCITKCWNQEDQTGIYSCPQCRLTFSPRPVLGKNTTMAEMVEKLKKTKLAAAGPKDVECDACIKIKYKAVKSCLVCLNSYCQNHLEQHESWFKGKKHSLMDANGKLQEMICYEHYKLLEVYCRTDQQCICMTCIMDQHENHETVKAAAERTEKQKPLEQTLTMFKQKINQRMKELKELRVRLEDHKRSAKSAVVSSEMMFTGLIRSIERCRSEVTQLIRDQEKAAVRQAEEHFVRLEKEIADLRRKEAALQELLHTDDHIHFLQSFQSLCAPPASSDLPSVTVSSVFTFDHVRESVSQLRTNLEDLCKEEIKKITDRVRGTQIISIPDPKTREEFLQDPWLTLEDLMFDDLDLNENKPPPPPPTSFPKVPMGGPGVGPPVAGGPGAGPPVNMFSRRAEVWKPFQRISKPTAGPPPVDLFALLPPLTMPPSLFTPATGSDEQLMEGSIPITGGENTEQINVTVPQVPAQPPAQGAPPTGGVTFYNPSQFAPFVPASRARPGRLGQRGYPTVN